MLSLLLLSSCSTDEGDLYSPTSGLIKLGEYDLTVPEPSGLTLGGAGSSLWTVSDQTGKAYEISFSGELLHETNFIAEDLEGVTFNPHTGNLWGLSEETSHAVYCNTTGDILEEVALDLGGGGNKGPEGIALDETGNALWLVNEANPTLLAFHLLGENSQQEWELNIADDLSGICVHPHTGNLWIVSDASEILLEVDINGNRISEFPLPVTKAEGVAFSTGGDSLWIVSDAEETLTLFTFPENQ